MITSILIGGCVLCVAVWIFSRPNKFPPGPKGLPLLGCLLSVSQWHPGCSFMGLLELYYRYGPVCGFYIGPQPVISISGYEACKEAFMNENLNGRPDNGPARMKSKGKRMGVMLVDGDFLTIQKRFTLHHLRDFGYGRQNMESLVSKEVAVLLADMKRQFHDEGNVFEFKNYFNISLVNALWVMLASARFERDDPRLKSLVELFDVVFRSGDIVRVAFPCPAILMKLFPAVFAKLGRMDLLKEVWKFIEEAIDEHKQTPSVEPRDFIDVYLGEVEKNNDDSFSEEQLLNIILDILSAGADTTGNSIGFALLYLIHHPDVQTKMQLEMDQVCGDSLPSLHHKPQLVYTQAVLMEVQRMSGVSPLAIPRRALKSIPFEGYIIPQDAYVIINMYSVHMDETYWTDPEVFRPERHIDKFGHIIKTDRLFPFGAGKRSCLGESLARTSYFLFTTSIVKTFIFRSLPDSISAPSLAPLDGFTLGHRPFQAFLTKR
ncbi:methyl farnesoate epoxidase-like [Daphnia pulex]|nr:methyl farnesoate epoxidase-like [Daphnia pulex]XP_046455636.1 methyl farnesoate epoxidase-like [Daphnia pulex]